MLQIVFINW